ncbi:T9SS type A sorting domain-containing protein [bacterium]|nr:T9SS type A sorting domain-containing protein [bacterium]
MMRRTTTMARTTTALALVTALAVGVGATIIDGITPWVISDGGGRMLSGDGSVALDGTIGQPAADRLGGGDYALQGGFWGGVGAPVATSAPETPLAGDRLQPAYPNPFNPATTLRFELASAGRVELAIYDARGRLVREIVDQDLPAGQHEILWRGLDDHGQQVASGIYLLRLQTPTTRGLQKLTLLK